MSGLGRFHCLLIATKGGDVIYERFYDRLSEYEKADVRAAFQLASSSVRLGSDGEQDHIGTYKWVFIGLDVRCARVCVRVCIHTHACKRVRVTRPVLCKVVIAQQQHPSQHPSSAVHCALWPLQIASMQACAH